MPAASIDHVFALALRHHQEGRLGEAEGLYRQVLAAQPGHGGAWHHLGIVAQQMGRHELAAEWISRAIALEPNNAAALSNLGAALVELGRAEEAIAAHRRALELEPGFAAAQYNLGVALKKSGRPGEAIAAYRRALELDPALAEAHNDLGVALAGEGHLAAAEAEYRQAIRLRPDFAAASCNLGNALTHEKRFEEAAAAYREAIRLNPNYAAAYSNLGNALAGMRQFEEATVAFRRALELQPDHAEAPGNLGHALRELGRLNEAVAAHGRALQLKPADPEALNHVSNLLREGGRFDEALAASLRALEPRPDFAEAWCNVGGALAEQGKLDEAIAAFRRALQLAPESPTVHQNLICMFHFHEDQDGRMIARMQEHWNRQFAEPLRQFERPHANNRDPERRLRIGYVSPNFNRHPITHFFTPLLEAHDKERVEVFCYASVKRPDAITERSKQAAGVWRDVIALTDEALAERILDDEIDILVDLTQHMAENRLLTFARKPAPVQFSWLAYAASPGLTAIDYRFTDHYMEPEDAPWSESVERPLRLPDCWFCYDPLDAPEPATLPALRTGRITFGNLNNFYKVNRAGLELWAAVLHAVEGSRLLLHCPAGSTQTRVREWFDAQGITADRLDLVPRTVDRTEYLHLYGGIDIGLDAFPYNGGTTTCEALWMGVPAVSLAGRTAVSRMGLSILSNVGLPELVARDSADYVRIATELAGDLPRLAELRGTLRARMRASPLMDAPRFARNIEAAYRTAWRHWCAEK